MRFLLIFILAQFLVFKTIAKDLEVDSLFLLMEKAAIYQESDEIDSAYLLTDSLLTIAKQKNNLNLQIVAYAQMSKIAVAKLGEKSQWKTYFDLADSLIMANHNKLDSTYLGSYYNKKGNALNEVFRHKESIEASNKSIAYLSKHLMTEDDSSILYTSYANLSFSYDEVDSVDLAYEYVQKSLHFLKIRTYADSLNYSSILSNISSLLDRQDRIKEGLQYIERSLEIRKLLFPKKHLKLFVPFHNIACSYSNNNQYVLSESSFKEAISIAEKNQQLYYLNYAKMGLGQLYSISSRIPESIQLHKDALLYFETNHPNDTLTSWELHYNIAVKNRILGNLAEASEHAEKCLALSKKLYKRPRLMAISYHIVSDCLDAYYQNSDPDITKKQLQLLKSAEHKMLEFSENQKGYDICQIYYKLSSAYQKLRKYDLSSKYNSIAINAISHDFDTLNTESLPTEWSEGINGYHIGLLLQRLEILNQMEDIKTRLKFETGLALLNETIKYQNELYVAKTGTLLSNITDVVEALIKCNWNDVLNKKPLLSKLFDLNANLKLYQKTALAKANFNLDSSLQQTEIPKGQLTLQFLDGKESIHVLSSFNRKSYYDKTHKSDSLNLAIKQIRMNSNSFDKTNFSWADFYLFDALVRPSLDAMYITSEQVEKLTLVPDGIIHNIPFDLLKDSADKKKYLIQNWPIQYKWESSNESKNDYGLSYRINVFARDQFLSSSPKDSSLIQSQFPNLGEIGKEIEYLSDNFKAFLNINNQCTKNRLESSPDKSILHIATHGFLDNQAPKYSFLVFGDNTGRDDQIDVDFISNLSLNNPLTVLSACSTGDGTQIKDNGFISLAYAFRYAGSRSVLMSRWSAPDATTPRIISGFYKYLDQGYTKSQALQQSKIDYLDLEKDPLKRHPYFWAGFTIIGEDHQVKLNGSNSLDDYWIVIALTILTLVVVIYIKALSLAKG